ncbi:MAG: 2-hydroxyacyl-CoA dehydratase [Eubacteriales bacterium]|nr:2-hydroxyacyl-CoA dehydratase [Eubacteriales bacterium]
MQDKSYIPFTEEMKKDYTVLIPNMLPMHFRLIASVLNTYGIHAKLLETSGPQIAETGLKYTHNDACYPAVLVIGQFMDALLSGEYDPSKTALIMFQTGGGCRASNYLPLIRKALVRAGLPQVPVISFSLFGLEKHPGFQLSLPMLRGMMYAVLYGDLLLTLVNQVKPYERRPGDAEALAARWTERLGGELGAGGKVRYAHVKQNYRRILADFAAIPKEQRDTVRVGVVGEIFVKYSPLANNHLADFLVSEGAEVTIPGLMDFCLFFIQNYLTEYQLYGRHVSSYAAYRIAKRFFSRRREDISEALRQSGVFRPWTPFDKVMELTKGYISLGAKMGEGWLLTAEMLELADSGCKNIVCAQPFGCLPNHICGKGMMRPIKEKNPDINIVAIDYDPGASRVNQENRLKLMLFNARRTQTEEAAEAADYPVREPIAVDSPLLAHHA